MHYCVSVPICISQFSLLRIVFISMIHYVVEHWSGCWPPRRPNSWDRRWWKGRGLFECQRSERMENACLKAHLHVSVQTGVFVWRERGSRTERSRGGVGKFSVCRRAQSIPVRTSKLVKGWCGVCHPGFKSFWLHSCRSANLPELGCLEVGGCIFWS